MGEPLEDLSYTTRTILRLVHDCGDHEADGAGPVSTREITRQTGLKNDTIRYHIDRLVDRGLVEIHPERVDVGAPIPANQYVVTDDGRQAVEELDERAKTVDELRERIRDHERRIENQQDQINRLRARVDDIEHEVKFH